MSKNFYPNTRKPRSLDTAGFAVLVLIVAFMLMGMKGFSQTHNIPYSGSDTWTTCSGRLYDHAGTGNYSNSANGYTVIYPSVAGNKVRLTGSYVTEGSYDYVTIFNGIGTGGTILYGPTSGTVTIPTITSTSSDGCLTVRFTSDGSVVYAGIVFNVSCVTAEMTVPSSGSNSYTTCSGNIYDNGGSAGNYGNSQDGYSIIYPSNSSQAVQLTGSYTTESGYEHIYIYNGAGTGGTLLYNGGSGSGSIGTITSSGANVPLTVRFTSDGSFTYSGFGFTISCVTVAPPCTPPGNPATYSSGFLRPYTYQSASPGAFTTYKGYYADQTAPAINEGWNTLTSLNWGGGSISGGNICGSYADLFAIKNRGYISLPKGIYSFRSSTDDGGRLYARWNGDPSDNVTYQDFSDWGDHAPQTIFGTVNYQTTGTADLYLDYQMYENGSGALEELYINRDVDLSTPTLAVQTKAGSLMSQGVTAYADGDWYQVDLVSGVQYRFWSTNRTSDLNFRFLDPAFAVVYSDVNGGDFDYSYTATSTGTYWLKVWPYWLEGAITYTLNYNSPNDNCANAIDIGSSLPYTSPVISNASATNDNIGINCDGPYKNLWWKVTGICGTMTAITCTGGTNFDDEIAVFTGSCGSFTEVVCNDDNGAGCTSNYAGVSWTSTTGTIYYISVGSYYSSSSTGNLQLNVTATPATPPGSPWTAGSNQWNVSCFNGFSFNTYTGYYTEPLLSFNTANRWGTGATPSDASGYQGCPIPADNHSYEYRRQGFPCAKYQVNIAAHDDYIAVYVDVNGDGTWELNNWNHLSCCDVHNNIWTGWLNSSSIIAIQTQEGGGGSQTAVDFVNVTPTVSTNMTLNGTAGDITVCPGATVTVAQTLASTSDQTTYYYWGTENPPGSRWVTTWDLCANCQINVASFNITMPSTPGRYVIHTNGYNPCSTYGPGTTYVVTVNSVSTAASSAAASPATICAGSSTTLSLTGGALGTGASWKWYNSSCGVGLVGTGASITVSPGATTTYYVRAEGTCNTTGCASTTVVVTSGISIANTPANENCPADNNGTIGISLSNGLSNIRYIQLTQQIADWSNLTELQAIEVFTGTNVALSGTATTNDFNGSWPPSMINDNITTGTNFWHSGTASAGSWVKVDLGSAKNLDYIRIHNRWDCCQWRSSNFLLQLYNASNVLVYQSYVNIYEGVDGPHTKDVNVLNLTWSDGGTTLSRTSLNAGSYTLSYSDVSGCSGSNTSNISTNYSESVAPSSISATATTICAGGSTTLTQVGGSLGSGASYQWFSGSCGGTSAGSGPSITVSPGSTTTYFVRASGTCNTTGCASTAVTVNAIPTITGTTPGSVCGTGTVVLGATASAGTINWYAASTGGASLGTGTTYTTPSISSTTTYYVDATASGCTTGSRTAVTATVNAIPAVTFTTGVTTACAGSTGNVYTTQAGMSNYLWSVSAGGTITAGGASVDNTVTVTWNTVGAQSVTVNYTNSNGCTATSATDYPVTVNGPTTGTTTWNGSISTNWFDHRNWNFCVPDQNSTVIIPLDPDPNPINPDRFPEIIGSDAHCLKIDVLGTGPPDQLIINETGGGSLQVHQ